MADANNTVHLPGRSGEREARMLMLLGERRVRHVQALEGGNILEGGDILNSKCRTLDGVNVPSGCGGALAAASMQVQLPHILPATGSILITKRPDVQSMSH